MCSNLIGLQLYNKWNNSLYLCFVTLSVFLLYSLLPPILLLSLFTFLFSFPVLIPLVFFPGKDTKIWLLYTALGEILHQTPALLATVFFLLLNKAPSFKLLKAYDIIFWQLRLGKTKGLMEDEQKIIREKPQLSICSKMSSWSKKSMTDRVGWERHGGGRH